jgi:hypothetical protein
MVTNSINIEPRINLILAVRTIHNRLNITMLNYYNHLMEQASTGDIGWMLAIIKQLIVMEEMYC